MEVRASAVISARQASDFWKEAGNTTDEVSKASMKAHWRGHGGDWDTDDKWLSRARHNFETYSTYIEAEKPEGHRQHEMVEWGVGGGANAIVFLSVFNRLFGVDIAQKTLDECGRQVDRVFEGKRKLSLFLADINNPEGVIIAAPSADLFLCTAVFQHFPYKAYGLRVLSVVRNLLRDSGIAMISFRTPYRTPRHKRRIHKEYRDNIARFCLFHFKEYERLVELAGLELAHVVEHHGELSGEMWTFLRLPRDEKVSNAV